MKDALDFKVLAHVNGAREAQIALDEAGAALDRLQIALDSITVELEVEVE